MTIIAIPPTATPPIVCPSWCTIPTDQHVADLPGWEGRVLHWSDLNAQVRHARYTFVDNTIDPADEPMVHVDRLDALTLDEAEALARQILAAVAEARA